MTYIRNTISIMLIITLIINLICKVFVNNLLKGITDWTCELVVLENYLIND